MDKLTGKEVAKEVNRQPSSIRKMRLNGEIEGVLKGGVYLYNRSVIKIIRNRPERRGRKPKHLAKNKV